MCPGCFGQDRDFLRIATRSVEELTDVILTLGYTPHVHFEIEGTARGKIDFGTIDGVLKKRGVLGHFKREYWEGQWEWASVFAGQRPRKAADDLLLCMRLIPWLLELGGAHDVDLRPVSWAGDTYRMAKGSRVIRDGEWGVVHVPNAVHVNISAEMEEFNALLKNNLGEILQRNLIKTSRSCFLLFCPEEDAIDRLSLKYRFGLERELSVPDGISSQSIAFYTQHDKHSRELGARHLTGKFGENLARINCDWWRYSRVEHRLGAASRHYSPHINAVFALANLLQSVLISRGLFLEDCSGVDGVPARPQSLRGEGGAVELFKNDTWFIERVGELVGLARSIAPITKTCKIKGMLSQLKTLVLEKYQPSCSQDLNWQNCRAQGCAMTNLYPY